MPRRAKPAILAPVPEVRADPPRQLRYIYGAVASQCLSAHADGRIDGEPASWRCGCRRHRPELWCTYRDTAGALCERPVWRLPGGARDVYCIEHAQGAAGSEKQALAALLARLRSPAGPGA